MPNEQEERVQEEELSEDSDDLARPKEPTPTEMKASKSKPKKKTGFSTLRDLQNKESSSDEEGQAFYAGGSEHSGQQILGPEKKHDYITDMFKSCKERSVASDQSKPSSSQPRPTTFIGTGYKLGMSGDDTEGIFENFLVQVRFLKLNQTQCKFLTLSHRLKVLLCFDQYLINNQIIIAL